MENSFRRWQFSVNTETVLHKYDMIMVYYYFSFLGFVNSQNLLNPMKKTFNYKRFPSQQKGPKTKQNWHKKIWRNMRWRQSQKIFLVYLNGWLLYIIGLTRMSLWEPWMGNLSCHEKSLASGFFSFFFFWGKNAFSNTLTTVLSLMKVALIIVHFKFRI